MQHKLQDIGLSDIQMLIFISLLALLTASIGVGDIISVPEVVMSVSLIILFTIYFHAYSHSHKVGRIIHGLFGNKVNSVLISTFYKLLSA